ncbi:MAG: hypothetical protein FJX76_03020 [Armatimonadetes bacterium]|nr:hypothetical protein [Armatimonadota bacterium]
MIGRLSLSPLTTPPAAAPPAPAPAPTPANAERDSVRLSQATIASGIACGATSALLCGVGAGVCALVGLPFVGPAAIATAVGVSTVFGGALAGLTLRKSFNPPPDTEQTFQTGRGPITGNLPFPTRDGASLILAENAMWKSLDAAAQAPDADAAAQLGSAGFERFGGLLAHGGERTTCVVLGAAVGSTLAGPLLGIPLGIAGGFAASYVFDKPAHLLGEAVGRAVGAAAGRKAYEEAHP